MNWYHNIFLINVEKQSQTFTSTQNGVLSYWLSFLFDPMIRHYEHVHKKLVNILNYILNKELCLNLRNIHLQIQ